ncbi:MAG TPA: hypothetical protein VJ226_12015 [Bradyrhizobium sp.]|jgi:hypothetical protein|nr:hypothetical protein [Bradyrhizobium sp.]
MSVQVSQRGKEYLEAARTLLQTAKSMSDQVIANRLTALAQDYELRAVKATHADAARALARSAARAENERWAAQQWA